MSCLQAARGVTRRMFDGVLAVKHFDLMPGSAMSCRKFFRRSLRVDDTRCGLFYQHTRPSTFSYRHSQCKPSIHRFRDGRSNSILRWPFHLPVEMCPTSQSGHSLTTRRKGEPRGPTSEWRRKPTPKHPCSRSLHTGCRIATLDLTNGLGIEDTTIASDGSLGPLAKSLWGIIKPVDRVMGEPAPPVPWGGPDMGDSADTISCLCGRSRHGHPRRWPGP